MRDCAFEVVAAYDRAIAARATHCARCNSTAPELVADQLPHHCEVTIQAMADYSYALVEGIEAAAGVPERAALGQQATVENWRLLEGCGGASW